MVTHVDSVSTFELGDPIAIVIEAESYDPARRGVDAHCRDVVA
jgi:hypothetical protein